MDDSGYPVNLPEAPGPLPGSKEVTLVIDTDRHVGEDNGAPETRVALIANQMAQLSTWADKHQIKHRFFVVAGAGRAAGFSDEQYQAAGCRIIDEADLDSLDPHADIVAALKEPTEHEKMIPGPFLRAGALHTGTFRRDGGLAALLRQRNFAAIFDGSLIGGYAFKLRGGPSVPLRGSMSKFAGRFAAEKVLEDLRPTAKVSIVISGVGIAGTAAAERLLHTTENRVARLVLVEEDLHRCRQLRAAYAADGRVVIVPSGKVAANLLQGAAGLILTAFRPDSKAPTVVAVRDLATMQEAAHVIDLAIDEGGSIESDGQSTAAAIAKLGRSIRYLADDHVPRHYPREASEAHGQAMLPYLAVMMYLTAQFGDTRRATEFIAARSGDDTMHDEFSAFVSDLRAGLVFTGPFPEIVGPVGDHAAIIRFLREEPENAMASHVAP